MADDTVHRTAPVRTLRETFGRFGALTHPDRPGMLAAALLLVVAAVADTVAVLMFMRIVDGVVSSGRLAAFWAPAGIWIGAAALSSVTTGLGRYLSARAAERFLLRLRDSAFGHLQTLAPDFFARHPTGDLVARLSGDVETIEELVSSGLVQATAAAVSVVLFAGAAIWLRWDLALAVLALSPLLLLASRRFAAGFRATAQAERTGNGGISTAVEQGIAAVELVQAHATERITAQRVHTEGVVWLRARLGQRRLSSIYTPLADLFDALGVVLVVGVGAWEIAEHRLTIGGVLGFATLLGFLYTPLHTLSSVFISVGAAQASADRLAEVLDTPPAIADRPGARTAPARTGQVVFSAVGFTHPGAAAPALADICFEVPPGRLVLVTGPSGAGKSTVGRLLLRFYDPTAGRILLDGTDVRDYAVAALRHSVTLLSQDTVIVEGTVAENISYGSPDAGGDQVRAAARAARAEEFVLRLPRGYGTPLDAGGPQLSGGQRRRIAIARALLRDTPVLVLDEPTTGLDAAASAALIPALHRLIAGRSTVLISHDLTFAPLADDVLVIDRGRLVERGGHAELLARAGLYRRLHEHRAGAGLAAGALAAPR